MGDKVGRPAYLAWRWRAGTLQPYNGVHFIPPAVRDYEFGYRIRYLIWRWVAKLLARLLGMAALWVRIQTSLKNTKWAT